MNTHRSSPSIWYWALTAVMAAVAVVISVGGMPANPAASAMQWLLYVHVPAAVCTLIACCVVFIANVGYVWQRTVVWDCLATAAAEVAFALCSLVLLTGMLWAHMAWDVWWTWSPTLTFSLALWMLYLVYLIVGRCVRPAARREIVCAIYGVVAFMDVPLIYLSVKLLPDKHPATVRFAPDTGAALVAWFVPVALVSAGVIHARWMQRRRACQTAATRPADPPPKPRAGPRHPGIGTPHALG